MRINNKPMDMFHMRINSFTYQPLAMERKVFQPERSLRPILGKMTAAAKSMQLVAEFRNKLDISNFVAEFMNHDETVIDIEDGYRYRCYLSKVSNPVSEYWQGWYRLTLSLTVIQEGSRRKAVLKKEENFIQIAGNWETECLYEITPKKNIEVFTIDGHSIHRLYANRTIYLDGELKKVYTETEPNKYPDCTLKDKMFPRLKPGTQIIRMSNTDANVVLRYTPIYV